MRNLEHAISLKIILDNTMFDRHSFHTIFGEVMASNRIKISQIFAIEFTFSSLIEKSNKNSN